MGHVLTVAGVAGVHVALTAVAEPDDAMLAALRADERARLSAMRLPARRREFVASRLLARRLFAERVAPSASGNPHDVAIAHGTEHSPDAPRVLWNGAECPDVHLSIAHAGGWAAVALGTRGPVGIDVTPVEARAPAFHRAQFSAAERAWASAASERERHAMFALLWALKECAFKAGLAPGATLLAYDAIEILVDAPACAVARHATDASALAPIPVRARFGGRCAAPAAWCARAGDAMLALMAIDVDSPRRQSWQAA